MPHRILDYIKENIDLDNSIIHENLINLGYDKDEIEDAFEEFEHLRHFEENLPLFPDPDDDHKYSKSD